MCGIIAGNGPPRIGKTGEGLDTDGCAAGDQCLVGQTRYACSCMTTGARDTPSDLTIYWRLSKLFLSVLNLVTRLLVSMRLLICHYISWGDSHPEVFLSSLTLHLRRGLYYLSQTALLHDSHFQNAHIYGFSLLGTYFYPNVSRDAGPRSRYQQLGASRKPVMPDWRVGLRRNLRLFPCLLPSDLSMPKPVQQRLLP